jgi:hypothetical protein
MKLIPSIQTAICFTCKTEIEYIPFSEEVAKQKPYCSNCKKYMTAYTVRSTKDCSMCKHFTTNMMVYPSGKCLKHEIGCGDGFHCDDFVKR